MSALQHEEKTASKFSSLRTLCYRRITISSCPHPEPLSMKTLIYDNHVIKGEFGLQFCQFRF